MHCRTLLSTWRDVWEVFVYTTRGENVKLFLLMGLILFKLIEVNLYFERCIQAKLSKNNNLIVQIIYSDEISSQLDIEFVVRNWAYYVYNIAMTLQAHCCQKVGISRL